MKWESPSVTNIRITVCYKYKKSTIEGAAMVLWLSSWLAVQEVQDLIPGLAATI